MKKILLFLILFCFINSYGQNNTAPLSEIDFLKEDPSMVLSIGLIQNVQTDWGKLGLRGEVKKLVEEKYSRDKKLLSRMIYDFNDKGRITRIAIMPDLHKYFNYTKNGQLEKEVIDYQTVREYNYKGDKLKEAEYNDNIVTSYGDDDMVNLFYNLQGQITRADYPKENLSIHYSHNDKGQIIEKKYKQPLSSGKDMDVTTTLEYNDENDIEKKFTQYITVDQPDTTFVVEMYSYKYDAKNANWLKNSYLGGGNVIHTHRAIYYQDGTYSGSEEFPVTEENYAYREDEVDINAKHPEEDKTLYKFLLDNINFKVQPNTYNNEMHIDITLKVSDKGEISDIQVWKDSELYDDWNTKKVTERLNKKWEPAIKNGKNVNSLHKIGLMSRITTTVRHTVTTSNRKVRDYRN